MTDFHHRMRQVRHHPAIELRLGADVMGKVEMAAWFVVTSAVSPRGINVTILENVNA